MTSAVLSVSAAMLMVERAKVPAVLSAPDAARLPSMMPTPVVSASNSLMFAVLMVIVPIDMTPAVRVNDATTCLLAL